MSAKSGGPVFLIDGDHSFPIRATKARVEIEIDPHTLEHSADVEDREQWESLMRDGLDGNPEFDDDGNCLADDGGACPVQNRPEEIDQIVGIVKVMEE